MIKQPQIYPSLPQNPWVNLYIDQAPLVHMHTTALFEQNSAHPALHHAIQRSIPAQLCGLYSGGMTPFTSLEEIELEKKEAVINDAISEATNNTL